MYEFSNGLKSTFSIDIMGRHLYGVRLAICINFYFLVSLCLLFTFSCPDSMWIVNMQSSAVKRQFFREKIQLFSPQFKSKTCTETWSIHSIVRCCCAIDTNIESKLISMPIFIESYSHTFPIQDPIILLIIIVCRITRNRTHGHIFCFSSIYISRR